MKLRIFILLALTARMAAGAGIGISAPGTLSTNWTGSQIIPDNNASGLSFQFSFDAPEPVMITNVTVDLTLAGGWDGDLYAYLSHGSGFCVLLNRIGNSSDNPGGSSAAGINVEFADSYLTDIHTGSGIPVSGNFAPDGRFVDPFSVLDTAPQTAMLGSFDNLDPSGTWTLFLADVSPLAVSTVQGWTVHVATTVPEPGCATLIGLAVALAITFGKRRKRQNAKRS